MQVLRIPFPPIFLPTLCLIGGILSGAQTGTPWIIYYILISLFGLLLSALCTQDFKPRIIQIVLSLGIGVWGFSVTKDAIDTFRNNNKFFSNHVFSFAGTITGKEAAPFYKKQTLIITGNAIIRSPWFKPHAPRTPCSIKLYTTDISTFAVGDQVYCPKLFWLPNKDDRRTQYLIREGICTTVTTKPEHIYLQQKSTNLIDKFLNWCADVKYKVLCGLQNILSPETYSLFCTLFLGTSPDHFATMEPMKNTFSNWGIFHYLSRSGLHVVIMLGLWQLMMRIFLLPYMLIQIILMLILALFWLLSWPSASFARSILSFGAIQATILQGQQPHAINIVSLICFLLLLLNPFHLFFLNFQLSFLLTWALALYYESVAHAQQ
jgi:hypothetical protein